MALKNLLWEWVVKRDKRRMATKSILAFGFTILLSLVLISCRSSSRTLSFDPAIPTSSLVQNNEKLMKVIDQIEHVCYNFTIFEDCIDVVKNDTSMTEEDRCDFLKVLSEMLQSKAKEISSITENLLPKETDLWSKNCLQACGVEYMMVQKYVEGIIVEIGQGNYKKINKDMKTIGFLAHECQDHFNSPPGSPFGFGQTRNSPFQEQNYHVKILALTAAKIADLS